MPTLIGRELNKTALGYMLPREASSTHLHDRITRR
jgi:hypothetical protein